ncbi:MAG: hypothetical protein M3406_14310 [Chloroflexota bacterium]|nr:hypothetical protein [Chloroflexota bacterium]
MTAILLLLTAALAGCQSARIPEEELRPDVIGVVESIETISGADQVFILEDSRRVPFNANDAESLYRSAPSEGSLLLSGEAEGGAWYVGLNGSIDCFGLSEQGEIRDGRIVFSSGLSLPLASDFDPRGQDSFRSPRGHQFCISAEGEVLSASIT